jgi:hypothetical protein
MVINAYIIKFREWLIEKSKPQYEVPKDWFFSETGDWTKFSKEIHKVNVSKGFWGEDSSKRNVGEALK